MKPSGCNESNDDDDSEREKVPTGGENAYDEYRAPEQQRNASNPET